MAGFSDSFKAQIQDIVDNKIMTLKLTNGKTVEQVLMESASLLREILYQEIIATYDYNSEWYGPHREYKFANSLYTDDMLSVDPSSRTVTIGFQDDMAWHDSWLTKRYGKNAARGYVPTLIDTGFKVIGGGYYPGQGYIDKAIGRFSSEKPPWITVTRN